MRDLVAILTQIEDTLRSTPFLIPRDGLMVVNPDIAPLLGRQRSIVAQLRARRISAQWRGRRPTRGLGLPAPARWS